MDKEYWKDKVVLVTGGHGFLGTHLVGELKKLLPNDAKPAPNTLN